MDDLTLKHMVEIERSGRHTKDWEGHMVIEIRTGRLATIIKQAIQDGIKKGMEDANASSR